VIRRDDILLWFKREAVATARPSPSQDAQDRSKNVPKAYCWIAVSTRRIVEGTSETTSINLQSLSSYSSCLVSISLYCNCTHTDILTCHEVHLDTERYLWKRPRSEEKMCKVGRKGSFDCRSRKARWQWDRHHRRSPLIRLGQVHVSYCRI
jgi:hypothetical protein